MVDEEKAEAWKKLACSEFVSFLELFSSGKISWPWLDERVKHVAIIRAAKRAPMSLNGNEGMLVMNRESKMRMELWHEYSCGLWSELRLVKDRAIEQQEALLIIKKHHGFSWEEVAVAFRSLNQGFQPEYYRVFSGGSYMGIHLDGLKEEIRS